MSPSHSAPRLPVDPQANKSTLTGRVPTSYILLVRLAAAMLNVAPPVVGSYALGRETYGVVASVLAMATIAFGMSSQVMSQNLLRLLCTAQPAERSVSATILFLLVCIGLAEALHFAGAISTLETLQLSSLILSLTLLRICEVKLISDEKVVPSIVVFYAAPPLLCSAFYLIAGASGGGQEAAAAAQSSAYGAAALIAMVSAKGVGTLLLQALRIPALHAGRELARSMSLLIGGGATAAAEFLPMVLLRGLNAYAVIPIYEIARKIASVPTTLANPLMNQVNPGMIRAYASRDQQEIQRLLRRMFRLLFYAGGVFFACVAATLLASLYDARVRDVAELLLPLSLGTLAAMWCVPYQSLLIAARGDQWFAISSGAAVVSLLVLTYFFSNLGPGLAVACAVAVSMATSGIIVRYRAIREA
jgi:O-antigen/teichoic acid export membrane protein